MESMDLKTVAGIMVATTAAIGGVKKLFREWVKGKEPFLALAIPLVFAVVSKLAGGWKATSWADLLVAVFFAALGSGLLHDKMTNPVMAGKKSPTGGGA